MKRYPYADFGLTIAICLFIITLINTFLFEITIVKVIWFSLCIGYFIASYKLPSDSKLLLRLTHALIGLSILMLCATLLFDTKTQPKVHAFEGMATDSTEEEIIILEDKDIPVELPTDTISEDSIQDTDILSDSINAIAASDSIGSHPQPVNAESDE